jgi:hypothetical protein
MADGGCSARRETRMRTKFWLGILKGTDNSEDLAAGRRIILKWLLWDRVW